jgi:hypothetical protein
LVLDPIPPTDDWFQGEQFVTLRGQDVDIRLSFVGDLDNILNFKVFILNKTDHPIIVDPAKFYYIALYDTTDLDLNVGYRIDAINPEYFKINQEKKYAYLVSNSKNLSRLSMFFNVATLISDFTTDKNELDYILDSEIRQEIKTDQMLNKIEQDRVLNRYLTISNVFLRKTKLPSRKIILGNVYFPESIETQTAEIKHIGEMDYKHRFIEKTRYLYLVFPVGTDKLTYFYKVYKY